MKTIIKYFLLVCTAGCFLACSKDIGNYEYQEINSVSIENFNTTTGYVVYFADSLVIAPTLTESIEKASPGHQYSYQWAFDLNNDLTPDSVISTEKVLRVKIGTAPGNYGLQYRVTDLETGVTFHVKTTLQVSTEVYEGYMVLNDVAGKGRLDMLSYDKTKSSFTQYTDVLKKMGSRLPEMGKPYQVYCAETVPSLQTAETYRIYLFSETGTYRIHSETFDYLPAYNIRYEMLGSVPADFKADAITGGTQFIFTNLFLMANNNVYIRAFIASSAWPYVPVNTYSAGGTPFPAAPYVVTDGGGAFVIYNTSARKFATSSSISNVSVTDIPASLNYPTGKDLLYMDRNYSGNAYAVLKDPASVKRYLLRFVIGAAPTYYEEILGTDIDKATHYAVSPDLGYLFYSVGGKVYEYDLSLKTSKLMLDKGTSEITYLAFQNFFRTGFSYPNYTNWRNLLTVGAYNASDVSGGGTLQQFTVPTVNGDLVQVNSWSGFGKITSVSYRERK